MTNESIILSWVRGYSIPFDICIPVQNNFSLNNNFSVSELNQLKIEINKLLSIQAIETCEPVHNQFCSPIFLVKKPNGDFRFILNLKELNKFIKMDDFKLEDYRTVTKLINKDDYLATIDIKDAYYMISIRLDHRKYLRFYFNDKLYQFNVLPFGLCTAPYVFTKILKPINAKLRENGLRLVQYLDDYILICSNYNECVEKIQLTLKLFTNLGFIVNINKCSLTPSHQCKFLGLVFNTENMTISITREKRENCLYLINKLNKKQLFSIRFLARVLGTLVSVCPAIKYGMLYTKMLERHKYLSLLKYNDNYEALISLPNHCKQDLRWWAEKVKYSTSPIRKGNFVLEIHTDASNTGWGASCAGQTASGPWTEQESELHINTLELKAAFFGLKSFTKGLKNIEILLRIDNTTAIAYINRLGGIQYPHLYDIARQIWQWCEDGNLWIFASYINTKDNVTADFLSRKNIEHTEWELGQRYYRKIVQAFGTPDIDLFASRTNAKCKKYVSWHPDPDAINVDAFTLCWSQFFFYAFPPFSLVLKTLEKIILDKAEGIVIVPYWTTQPWFPVFKKLLVNDSIVFQPSKKLLTLCNYRSLHPLYKNLSLMAGLLSARNF
ncbi:unnamed protein product [Parnassius mnemosyne]|uniref:Reverse transcriptase domain-containing protein n=1 Tax=Parnassius mnemosyne TaxID=213953 RepID=A0AAV1M7D5_9NEOP